MATIFRVSAPVHPGTSPAGNVSALEYPITIGANKQWVEGAGKTALANSDKLVLGKIPAGFKLLTQKVYEIKKPAALVLKIGFEYCDGVDDPALPQNADISAVADGMAGGLPKDAWLVGVVSTAPTGAGRVSVVLTGINDGK